MMIWLRRLLYTIGAYEYKVLIVYYECETLRLSNSKDSGTLSKTTLSPTGMLISVLPTGAAINCTKFAPGAEADLTMFRNNSAYHRSALQKLPNEFELTDDGPLLDQYANDWAVLVDKGYQGLVREFRAIQPKKKARGAPPLTMAEKRENDLISHDRVIVENYFGRLKTLWGVCSHKWGWDDKSYDTFFRACVAMTNYSVRCCPLRREDGENYLRYEERLKQIGAEIEAEKQRKRAEYRDSRRARLQLAPRSGTRPRTSPSSASRRSSITRGQMGSPCSTTYGSP
ncbi:unnamed protein product [Phytophthora fragariaefolia]|uniref:Unnamed protein product n=1 Tax=Phytophthora fragariaefolia TaxID=1490495 RepID=A0A9W6U625_9STRA|nr:unnamed protein product [Phytophthora fragariaefolia]